METRLKAPQNLDDNSLYSEDTSKTLQSLGEKHPRDVSIRRRWCISLTDM